MNIYMWSSYEETGEKIRTYRTPGASDFSDDQVAMVEKFRPEILAELRRLGRVAPPKGINIPGLPPTVERPPAPKPAPADGEGPCPPEMARVRQLYASKDLKSLEEATSMMIRFTEDERAQAGHAWSINTQKKFVRLLIAGDLPLAEMEAAMQKAKSPTAERGVRPYIAHLKGWEKGRKNKVAGAPPRSPGHPDAISTSPG